MFLSHMNYREVEAYLKTSDTIVIPVGSLENHGLHMPLGTDSLIPDQICKLLNERSDLLIAPAINYGATDDLMGFAGTVSIGTEGLISLLRTICDQLYRYGFRHFMILNGHGGNTAAIQAVGSHLYRKGAYLAILNWWLMAGQINPEWAGGHGGGEETAAIMAVDPALIKREYLDLPENIRNDLGDELPYGAWTSVQYKGVSVTVPREIKDITDNGWLVHSFKGDVPSRATPEWGREMLEATADYIADFASHFGHTGLLEKKEDRKKKWFWQRKEKDPIQMYEGKNVFLLEDESSPYESILIRAVLEKGCLKIEDAELDHDLDNGGWTKYEYRFDEANTRKLFDLLGKEGKDPYKVMGSMIDRDRRMHRITDLCKEQNIVYQTTFTY